MSTQAPSGSPGGHPCAICGQAGGMGKIASAVVAQAFGIEHAACHPACHEKLMAILAETGTNPAEWPGMIQKLREAAP